MITRIVCSLVLAMRCRRPPRGVSVAWAEAPRTAAYSLPDILTLAVQHNPTLAGAEGLVKQSQGQQIAAGAYPNPVRLRQRRAWRHSRPEHRHACDRAHIYGGTAA